MEIVLSLFKAWLPVFEALKPVFAIIGPVITLITLAMTFYAASLIKRNTSEIENIIGRVDTKVKGIKEVLNESVDDIGLRLAEIERNFVAAVEAVNPQQSDLARQSKTYLCR